MFVYIEKLLKNFLKDLTNGREEATHHRFLEITHNMMLSVCEIFGKDSKEYLEIYIVGLDMTAAKEAFNMFLKDVNLDDRQIYFVNQIIEYIVRNGVMKDLSVLQESPFTDKGSVVELFKNMSVWTAIRKAIDYINTNAAA